VAAPTERAAFLSHLASGGGGAWRVHGRSVELDHPTR